MSAAIDIDALRRTIAEAPAEGACAGVTRSFLEQVERELRAGRVAMAELARAQGIAHVIETIQA